MKKLLLLSVVALALAGCASVDKGNAFNGMQLSENPATAVQHLNADSWGIYLFPIFPLITGDTSTTAGGIAFGEDSTKVEPVVGMLTRAAKEEGATKVVAMTSSKTSFPILPPIIWYKSCQVSGNAVR